MKKIKRKLTDSRTFEQIRNHYEVEKTIAERLKKATREERKVIYQNMYDELFEKVPNHPRLSKRENSEMTAIANKTIFKLVSKFIDKSKIFVEFAPGDCRFAMFMCNYVEIVYGVDISDQKGEVEDIPTNFNLVVYDGYSLDLQGNYADVVFSNQFIEHLHPEDTEFHFKLVGKILKPGGKYIFQTPHKFTGPHDISRLFSIEPEGFHLKEWTYLELAKIIKQEKFLSYSGYFYLKGFYVRLPFFYFVVAEYFCNLFPYQARKVLAKYLLKTNIIMVATK